MLVLVQDNFLLVQVPVDSSRLALHHRDQMHWPHHLGPLEPGLSFQVVEGIVTLVEPDSTEGDSNRLDTEHTDRHIEGTQTVCTVPCLQ